MSVEIPDRIECLLVTEKLIFIDIELLEKRCPERVLIVGALEILHFIDVA